MSTSEGTRSTGRQPAAGTGGYGLGMIGAAVYYVQEADGAAEVIVGLLKALVWPAFLVYELLSHVGA